MIDPSDYKEPSCLLCEGKDFYNPKNDSAKGRIPVGRIIDKVDGLFNKNDYEEAGKLLLYWKNEAKELSDKEGELSIESELIGYYRKVNDKVSAYECIDRALLLIEDLGLSGGVSSATIFLNSATGFKAFGEPEKALPLYEKTLDIYNKFLEKNDEKFAGLFNNCALTLVDLKDYPKAEDYYKKALSVLGRRTEFNPDIAITYVNMAHLYYTWKNDKNLVNDCLFSAYNLLIDEKTAQNGYLAFVLSKCAPSFGFFGFDLIEKEFNNKSEELYERS